VEQPLPDDFGLIAPISLPLDGQAPGTASGPDEYDAFFRIHHDNVSSDDWTRQILAVTRTVADDVDSTSLGEKDRADLLDGLTLLLQHALRLTTDK
jgi:hypothetical protein